MKEAGGEEPAFFIAKTAATITFASVGALW